jgi:hypothetical protein
MITEIEWIPVEQESPGVVLLLVALRDGDRAVAYRTDEGWKELRSGYALFDEYVVTHWAYLPDHPNAKGVYGNASD